MIPAPISAGLTICVSARSARRARPLPRHQTSPAAPAGGPRRRDQVRAHGVAGPVPPGGHGSDPDECGVREAGQCGHGPDRRRDDEHERERQRHGHGGVSARKARDGQRIDAAGQLGTTEDLVLEHLGHEVGAEQHDTGRHREVPATPSERDAGDDGSHQHDRRDADRVQQPVGRSQDAGSGCSTVERGIVEALTPPGANRDDVQDEQRQERERREQDETAAAVRCAAEGSG